LGIFLLTHLRHLMAGITMHLRFKALCGVAAAGLSFATLACTSPRDREAQREAEYRRQQNDRNSAAFRAGEAARELTRKAEHAAAVAGRELNESARKAREGWKEQSRRDREEHNH
jgi:hypothetical protein